MLAVAVALPAAAGAQQGGADARCPWAGPEPATIGIERLLCRGGSCSINVEDGEGLAHRFSTEPVIQRLAANAPEELNQGDVIVAVDGVLITTPEGGRRLANLQIGTPVTLTLRGRDRTFDVTLTPFRGCPTGGLSVRIPG
jgi:hypothetical protein